MTQEERRIFLIRELWKEENRAAELKIPSGEQERARLLRMLFNLRPPRPAKKAFLEVQDAYLQEETRRKGITDLSALQPASEDFYLWQGDITTLRCDAIVNAANSQMLGCFIPCHGCIDNMIHTFAGIQLRLLCSRLMTQQGRGEPTGQAKITPAFNLPSRYILHTVGPVISGCVTERDRELLASCYRSCFELAEENNCKSIAFCCISTGEFHFPNQLAAEIAVKTVKEYKAQTRSEMKVIFNVFKDTDAAIYRALLQRD